MKIYVALFFAVLSLNTVAQSTQVPHKMSFAGMTLTIRDDARRLIQKDVDALMQSPKHFNIKAERAKTYFPIIEKVFAEEGVPDDFKYLVLQESALIPDAVSVSNAVGFWQFKDFTAMEMGLRVDNEVDERMSITASTRAAAKYIKKNNTFFDNWLYALQAYQMGAGGVMRSVKDSHSGETHAEITSDTYWYVRKFLSYKVAFEQAVGGKGEIEVLAYQPSSKETLSSLAKEFAVDEEELKAYNKWAKKGTIPNDRAYTVLVPSKTGVPPANVQLVSTARIEPRTTVSGTGQIQHSSIVKAEYLVKKINGVKAIQALKGETPLKLAERANVDLVSFLKWNDITYNTVLSDQVFYFLGKKRNKSKEDYHTLAPGESLWLVSQKYGVKMNKLLKFNRLETDEVAVGTTIYLSSMKPKSEMNVVKSEGAYAIVETNSANDNEETFSWAVKKDSIVVDTVKVKTRVIVDPALTPAITSSEQVTSTDTLQVTQVTVIKTDSATVVQPVVDLSSKTEHVVQPKETLYAIAHLYNMGVMDLVRINNLDLQQGLRIGQVLKLKEAEIKEVEIEEVNEPSATISTSPQASEQVMASSASIHEVKSSDTLYSIARKYGVTIKDIMDWNQKKDFSISVGEKLKVKPD